MTWRAALRQRPPAGDPVGPAELLGLIREGNPAARLRAALSEVLGPVELALFASGREALRVAFRWLADCTGRNEIVSPAYCCYSVPAAAVAAGLRVRLVDVDAAGRMDADRLARLPLERAAAVVVANLFGIPEPIRRVAEVAAQAGAYVIDDAAQALGGRDAQGAVGTRGDLGLLSFARGKPLFGLGGGALCLDPRSPLADASEAPAVGIANRLRAICRALAYDLVRAPMIFPWVARIPRLHVGETLFDPRFEQGAIDTAALALVGATAERFQERARKRAAGVEAFARLVRAQTEFLPLLADDGSEGVYPRMALLAPRAESRELAVAALQELGAGSSTMYPGALDQLEALKPYLESGPPCTGARSLAAQLLTLPAQPAADKVSLVRALAAAGGRE